MISKKYVIIASVVAVLAAGAMAVSADNGGLSVTGVGSTPVMKVDPRTVVQIGPQGNVLLRGTVVTTATGTVTVSSWGGDWTVNVLPTSQLMPGTGMTTGDFVGVQGTINTATPWTIDAKLVRDWSVKVAEQTNKEAIKDMVARNWEGVASNVNGSANTLTLTVNGTAYNIVLAANVKVVNKLYVTLPFASIQNGDTVRVYGAAASGTITAIVVRDVSK